jgi:Ankyrin repeats (many copies)
MFIPCRFKSFRNLCIANFSPNIRLETPDKLLWYYKYISHPKQTIFFLEQDGLLQRDPANCQKGVAAHLAWKIRDELANVVQRVDASHCSAEHVLLLVQEVVYRFRGMANDPEALLELECGMLGKRVRVAQRSTAPKGKQREAVSPGYKGRLLHQLTLEMERNQLIGKIKPSSRSVSPGAASTPSSDMSAGSKRVMKQADGLFISREIANLLEGSSITSHVPDYILEKLFAKNRRLRGKKRVEFPALHIALLFATEQEARSSLESNNGNVELVDFFKRNVAHVAAEVGRVHLLNAVLPGYRESLDTPDAFGLTPLMIAILHGRLACCKLLIDAGFRRDVRDSRGRNLLSIACRRRHLHIVKYLVEELGFLPNDDSGGYICSPLHDAIEAEDVQISTFLIESGANVYQHFNSKSPGDLALEKELTNICQLINEKITCSGLSQVDAVSAHLGYQHEPNPQYNAGDIVDHQYVHDSRAHDAASHSPNVPLYLPTTTNTQYMDPRQLGHTWNQQLRN